MTVESAKRQLERVIERGERLIWVGQPDLKAMLRGTGHGSKRTLWLVLIIGIAGIGVGSMAYKGGPLDLGNLATSFDWSVLAIAAFLLFAFARAFFGNRGDVENWAEGMSYGITDKRLLVLRDGAIEHEYFISDVNQPELVPRRYAPGFSDIIWGQTVMYTRSRDRGLTARQKEDLRVGFKALADGETVMKKLESWRESHLRRSAEKTASFVAKVEDGGSRDPLNNDTGFRKLRNSAHNFSIEIPDSWELLVRYRKLAFGKWGIEREAEWGTQEGIPKWNMLRAEANVGSYVELQVHNTKPINTLDEMLNSSAAKLLRLTKVVDQDASIEIGGIRGFYLTREREGKANTIRFGQTLDVSIWHMRQYVLHDGRRQFYFEALWPADSESQREICEALISTLRTH